MEPVSLIVGALVSGAAAAAQETGAQAIKDSYQALKAVFIKCWKKANHDENKAQFLLDGLEKSPESLQSFVESEIHDAMPSVDPELLALAQKLTELVEASGQQAAKFNVNIEGSQGVQVGDNNTQNISFNSEPGAK